MSDRFVETNDHVYSKRQIELLNLLAGRFGHEELVDELPASCGIVIAEPKSIYSQLQVRHVNTLLGGTSDKP